MRGRSFIITSALLISLALQSAAPFITPTQAAASPTPSAPTDNVPNIITGYEADGTFFNLFQDPDPNGAQLKNAYDIAPVTHGNNCDNNKVCSTIVVDVFNYIKTNKKLPTQQYIFGGWGATDQEKIQGYINDSQWSTAATPGANPATIFEAWGQVLTAYYVFTSELAMLAKDANATSTLFTLDSSTKKITGFTAQGNAAMTQFQAKVRWMDAYISIIYKSFVALNSPSQACSTAPCVNWRDELQNGTNQVIGSVGDGPDGFKLPRPLDIPGDIESGAKAPTFSENRGGLGGEFRGYWDTYTSMIAFIQQYRPIHEFKIDLVKGKSAEDAIKALSAAVKVGGAIDRPDGGNAIEDDCGAIQRISSISEKINNALCGLLAITMTTFVKSLLGTGAVLLNETSGGVIPSGNARPPSGEFASLIDIRSLSRDFAEPVENVLINQNTASFGYIVGEAYRRVLQLLNFILILTFIFLALVSILQIQVDKYNLKKILPALIIAFIAAQFSFFIVRAALAVSTQITKGFTSTAIISNSANSEKTGISGFVHYSSQFPFPDRTFYENCPTKPGMTGFAKYMNNCNYSSGQVDAIKVLKQIINNIFTLVPAAFLLILAFMFVVRRLIFFVLVPLAPLAVISQAVPFMSNIWTRWYKLLSGWLFMPLAAGFWIWMALIWFGAIQGATGLINSFFGYAFAVMALYMAVKTPFSLAGEASAVMNQWNKIGRAGYNNTAGRLLVNATPYGAGVRAINKFQNLQKQRDQEWRSGDVIKGGTARALGGNTINRAFERQEIKIAKRNELQEAESKKIKAEAEAQVTLGSRKLALDAMKTRRGLQDVGNSLEGFANRMDKIGKLFRVTQMRTHFSYGNIARTTRDRAAQTEQLSAETNLAVERQYSTDGVLAADENEFLDLMKKLKDAKATDPDYPNLLRKFEESARHVFGNFHGDRIMREVANNNLDTLDRRVGVVGSLTNQKTRQKRIMETRARRYAVTAGAKAAQEKVRSDAEGNSATSELFKASLNNNIEELLNDRTTTSTDHKAQSLWENLKQQADAQGGNDRQLRDFLSQRGITDAASAQTNFAALQEHFAAQRMRGIGNRPLNDAVVNRYHNGLYPKFIEGKRKYASETGSAARALNTDLAATNPDGYKTWAKAMYGDPATLGTDKGNKAVINIGAIHQGITDINNPALKENATEFVRLLDKINLEVSTGRDTDPRTMELQRTMIRGGNVRNLVNRIATASNFDQQREAIRQYKQHEFVTTYLRRFQEDPSAPVDHKS